MKRGFFSGVTAGLVLATSGASAGIIFQDTFDRADSRNTDASLTGITDNTGSSLAADGVYSHPFLDPNNADPINGAPDSGAGSAGNGGGAQILTNQLELADGAGTSNLYINHNFLNSTTFTASVNMIGIESSSNGGELGALAIGLSQARADAALDANNGNPKFTNVSSDTVGTANADFWIGLHGRGQLAYGSGDGARTLVDIFPPTNVNKAAFEVNGLLELVVVTPDFNAGTTANVAVKLDGNVIANTTFQWSETNQNYIGLDARDGSGVFFDDLTVTDVPEPGSLALVALGALAMGARRRR